MKKFFFNLILASLCAWALTACKEDSVALPSATVEVVSTGTLGADFVLKTSRLTEFAYQVTPSGDENLDPSVLFAVGTVGTLVDGENTLSVSGLDGNSNYTLAVAFKVSEEQFYEEVLLAEFATTDYEETFTLVRTDPTGFKAHFKIPQSVKDNGNVIRYGASNLFDYNASKLGWRAMPDYDLLVANGQLYWDKDSDLDWNNENNTYENEWGEAEYHYPFSPGEPLVFLAGEFSYDETGDNNMFGLPGWYIPAFDIDAYYDSIGGGWGPLAVEVDDEGTDEDKFWTGYFTRRHFRLAEPEPLQAEVDIQADVRAVKGTLTITPDENVFRYCYLIVDDATLEEMILPYLGNEEYLQWFVTSYTASFNFGASYAEEPIQIAIEDYVWAQPETKYHLLLTAMGNDEGTTQNFRDFTFSTTAKTMPAPKIEVKAIPNPSGTESPYQVWFNVKCTSKDATSAKYAANYAREFGMLLNNNYTYNDIVSFGNSFYDDELALINSDSGFDVSFSTMPGETTRLAVVAYNEEDTPNEIEGDDSPAVADVTAIKEPDAPAVDSPLFTALRGDWTMSADVESYSYPSYVPEGNKSCKVVIMDKVTYPETLPASVYDVYRELAGLEVEEVDNLYAEFKQEAEEYNARLKGQNRLLCLGFGYEASVNNLEPATPFDLFVSDRYNGYDNHSMFWDFGPKWYLEIAADGSVSVPVNSSRLYPMSSWVSSTLYLGGYCDSGAITVADNDETARFSVTVSDDNSTITVNPITYNDEAYYPNAMSVNYGYAYLAGYKTVSALTLTKGWTEPEAPALSSTKAVAGSAAGVQSINSSDAPAAVCPVLRKTPLNTVTKYKKVDCKPLSKEEILENMKAYYASKR
ncbi:MAG: hypothetical protein ACI3ZO_05580 [Candidatus Cryptobacteroides sp.]